MQMRVLSGPMKYSNCVFQPFFSPTHPPTSILVFNFISKYLLYFL